MSRRQWVGRSVVLLSLAGIGGCEGKPAVDAGNVEATVHGVVKIDGVPPKSGQIAFDSSNYQRTAAGRSAPIRDGEYTITTLTGRNIVRITGPLAKSKPLLQQQTRSVEIKEGDNLFDMEFTAH